MDIFVFADESGVFDANQETPFVFGGLLYVGAASMESSQIATASQRLSIAQQTTLRR